MIIADTVPWRAHNDDLVELQLAARTLQRTQKIEALQNLAMSAGKKVNID